MGTAYALSPHAKALNISVAFGFANGLPSSYSAAEIKAEHQLGTLIHHFPWVLDGLCREVPGNKATLKNIVSVLNERTLYKHKPFEAVTISSLLDGQITMGQSGCGAAARSTAARLLNALVKAGILVKVVCHGFPTLYALNIPRVIEHLRARIASVPADRGNTRVQQTRDMWAKVESVLPLLEQAHARTLALVHSTVENLKTFGTKAAEVLAQAVVVVEEKAVAVKEAVVEKVAQAKEVVKDLADKVKLVAKGREVVAEERKKKSEQPLFDKKGRPIGRVALALWHTKVRDYPEHYGAYHETSTAKMVGQMNNLLNELKAQGKDEDQIRQFFTDLIENWHRPMFDNRKILITIEKDGKGKSWPIDIPLMPEFAFFYPHRAAVVSQVFTSINRHVASLASGSPLTKGFKIFG